MKIIEDSKIGKFFGLLIGGFIIMVFIGIYLQKKQWENYPVVTYKTQLKGEVKKIRINRGTLGELTNGQKFSLPSSDNYSYSPHFIGRFINRGDYIQKDAFSDTLFVYRDEKEYYFILGESIEE